MEQGHRDCLCCHCVCLLQVRPWSKDIGTVYVVTVCVCSRWGHGARTWGLSVLSLCVFAPGEAMEQGHQDCLCYHCVCLLQVRPWSKDIGTVCVITVCVCSRWGHGARTSGLSVLSLCVFAPGEAMEQGHRDCLCYHCVCLLQVRPWSKDIRTVCVVTVCICSRWGHGARTWGLSVLSLYVFAPG